MIRKKKDQDPGKIVLDLTGPQGNAFAVLARARSLANQLELDWDKINTEATSGDYDNLIKVIDKYLGDYIIFEK